MGRRRSPGGGPTVLVAVLALLLACGGTWTSYGAPGDLDAALAASRGSWRDSGPGETVLRGELAEVCAAGCWFVLLDDSGLGRVELDAAAGFVIPKGSSGREAIVRGQLSAKGPERILRATTVWLR